jgi:O-antigen ligase
MCLGAVAAAYIIVGRWTPARMSATPESWQLPELRTLLLAVLAVGVFIRPEPKVTDSACRSERTPARWVLASLAYLVLSVTWSVSPDEGLRKLGECAPMLLAIVLASKLFLGDPRGDAKKAFWATFTLLGLALGGLALGLGVNAGSRVSVLGGGPNVFGRNMGLAFIAAMFMSVCLGIRSALLVAAVAPLLVIMSGSRGALAGILAAILVMLYYSGVRMRTWLPVLTVAALIALLTLYSPLGSPVRRIYNERIEKLTFGEHHTSGRDSLYAQAIEVGLRHRWFGAGLGGFSGVYGDYPHNLILESFAEGGAVGAGLVLLGLILACGGFIKNRHLYDQFSVAAFALSLVTSQFSGDLFDSRGVFLFLVLALSGPAIRRRNYAHSTRALGESEARAVIFAGAARNSVARGFAMPRYTHRGEGIAGHEHPAWER